MQHTPFALPALIAMKQMREREAEFRDRIARGMTSVEPREMRRRVR